MNLREVSKRTRAIDFESNFTTEKDSVVYNTNEETETQEISPYSRLFEEGHRGNAESMYKLANVLRKGGVGIKPNSQFAVGWYRKAAMEDHVDAKYQLAKCYYTGMGYLEKDLDCSIYWFREAAKQGHEKASYMAGFVIREKSKCNNDSCSTIQIREICETGDTGQFITWLNRCPESMLNERCPDGSVPLNYARNAEMALLMIEKKANIEEVNSPGHTPLQVAILKQNTEVVSVLLERKADVNTNAGHYKCLYLAAETGDTQIVRFLLNKKANVDAISLHRDTALGVAAGKGYIDIVQILIENGADMNLKNDKQMSPFYLAVNNRYLEIVELMIDKGARLNEIYAGESTALSLALLKNNSAIAQLLINRGANVNQKMKNGPTALHLALKNRNTKIATLIIEKGGDINEIDNDGHTPLHVAIKEGNLEICKFLVEKQANIIYKKCAKGKELIYYCVISGNLEVVKYFAELKCSLKINNRVRVADKTKKLRGYAIQNYILEYKETLERYSLHRNRILSIFGEFNLPLYSLGRPPNIGFVNLMRTCKYPVYHWGMQDGFCPEIVCLVLLYLSVVPSPFLSEWHNMTEGFKWKHIGSVPYGMEMLAKITYFHLIHQRTVKGSEIGNTRSLYDSEFATTAIEEVYGRKICSILYS